MILAMPSPPRALAFVPHAAAIALAATSLGCSDVSRFSTAPGEAYCGAITLGSEFRQGMSPRVQMRVELDAAALDVGDASPGRVSTFEGADPGKAPKRMLDEAELRPIPPLQHDALAQLDFGSGRERNAMFAVAPVDPAAESVLAVVSLRSDETIEVRLIRPGLSGAGADLPEGRRPLYGLFPLSRQAGLCGF